MKDDNIEITYIVNRRRRGYVKVKATVKSLEMEEI